MDILPKLDQMQTRFAEIEAHLGAPDAAGDMERFTRLNKEYAELRPVVEAAAAYKKMLTEKADLEALLADKSTDADMREMAAEELPELKHNIETAEHNLQVLLLPKDEADDRDVILEIRAGTGGDEAALFVADLFRMYSRYAALKGWKIEVMDTSETQLGGLREIVAHIHGQGVFGKLKFESGTHRVQRVPATETQGRIHTSAVTVAVLPEAEEVDAKVDMKDVRIDIFRSSGPGGQSVNTTDSAVRVTHVPTGIVAQCQDEKSQHKNKEKALKVLFSRIYDAERERIDKERASERKSQIGSGDRSERIRTYNFPQSRVTDHRINLTLHNLEMVMEGEKLDDVIEPLLTENQAQRLASLGENE